MSFDQCESNWIDRAGNWYRCKHIKGHDGTCQSPGGEFPPDSQVEMFDSALTAKEQKE
jgi:hypothetical protein